MATTVTTVITGTNTYTADVARTADDDTASVSITHGLTQNGVAIAPKKVTITSLAKTAAGLGLSLYWSVASISTSLVVITTTTTAGTGVAGNQIRLSLEVPQTSTI